MTSIYPLKQNSTDQFRNIDTKTETNRQREKCIRIHTTTSLVNQDKNQSNQWKRIPECVKSRHDMALEMV